MQPAETTTGQQDTRKHNYSVLAFKDNADDPVPDLLNRSVVQLLSPL